MHLLHIGKTGGSAIKSVLQHAECHNHLIKLHNHDTAIKDVPLNQGVIFFLRDPVSRFCSGFYSRKRKGKPRYNFPWNKLETEVFNTFDTPADLATSLAEPNSNYHSLAIEALSGIEHFRHYDNWYTSFSYFNSRLDDILFIGFQESLNSDFDALKVLLGLDQQLTLPSDDIRAHRNPSGLDKFIPDAGLVALKQWYAEDYEFIKLCHTLDFSGRGKG